MVNLVNAGVRTNVSVYYFKWPGLFYILKYFRLKLLFFKSSQMLLSRIDIKKKLNYAVTVVEP